MRITHFNTQQSVLVTDIKPRFFGFAIDVDVDDIELALFGCRIHFEPHAFETVSGVPLVTGRMSVRLSIYFWAQEAVRRRLQFGEVFLRIEPLARGARFEFVNDSIELLHYEPAQASTQMARQMTIR